MKYLNWLRLLQYAPMIIELFDTIRDQARQDTNIPFGPVGPHKGTNTLALPLPYSESRWSSGRVVEPSEVTKK